MATISPSRLQQVIDRFEQVEARMGAATETAEIIALSREHSDLKPVVDKARELMSARKQLSEAEALVASGDPDMAELARDEVEELKDLLPALEQEVQVLLLPKDVDDKADIVIELRAGTGGYKELIANVSGDGVFGHMKWESGVHRVQRVPATETQGRIHTSAATVAVLPAPENVEIDIRPEDIRIDTMRSSGAGGQHVNTTDSAVRITHLPTGLVATSSEKSQHVNREKAMDQLKIRLYERERSAKDAERAEARASQIGSGDRSQKVRTYNFPENRMTDHRIGLTLYSLDRIITGDKLNDVVEALITEDQARKLAAMENEN